MRQALAAGMSRFPEDGAGPLETLCAPVCAVQASCALEQLDKFLRVGTFLQHSPPCPHSSQIRTPI